MNNIYLKCIKECGKLRIKIISHGYNQNANCQFPRNLRVENRIFIVPAQDISVANTQGRFFYRIAKHNIQIIEDNEPIQQNINLDKIYEIYECCICMDNESNMIFVPCGHLCICMICADTIRNQHNTRCPMCRTITNIIIDKKQLT